MSEPPPSVRLASRLAKLLPDTERLLVSALGLALFATLVIVRLLPGQAQLSAATAGTSLVLFLILVALVGTTLVLVRNHARSIVCCHGLQWDRAESRAAGRHLGVTLSPSRQATLGKVVDAVVGSAALVATLPRDSALYPVASSLVVRQRTYLPDVERTLRLAQFLDDQAAELGRRATTPAALEKLAYVQDRVATMDAEAESIAILATEAQASILGTLGSHDQAPLLAMFADLAEHLETHYTVMRELGEAIDPWEADSLAEMDLGAAVTGSSPGPTTQAEIEGHTD